VNKRYVPNLPELHSLAERNYSALAKLFGVAQVTESSATKCIAVGEQMAFTLQPTAQARYTTDLLVTQVAPDVAEYLQARFLVRLYHDARMAEIVDCQGQERLTALQPANLRDIRHRKDEKLQLNQHLAAWLRLCFARGRSPVALNCLLNR